MGCLQGWIVQGARDEHCERALEPETGTSTSASHLWMLHRQPCCALPMQTAASEQMTETLVEAHLYSKTQTDELYGCAVYTHSRGGAHHGREHGSRALRSRRHAVAWWRLCR